MERGPQRDNFEMEKIGNLDPERLIGFIKNAKDREEAEKIIGAENLLKVKEFLSKERMEKYGRELQEKKDREKEELWNQIWDESEEANTNLTYPRK